MKDTLVLDLETKKTFDEVGGERNIRELGISVAGVYSYAKDAFFALEEHELPKLEEMLKETGHIIGFAVKQFDLPVLAPYIKEVALERIAVTDIFDDAVKFLGHRVGLNAVAKATLGAEKSGHGLEALKWFREGRVEEVKKYCLDDVRLTRDVYEYGKTHGHILFTSYGDGKVHSIPVKWNGAVEKPVAAVVAEAFENRRRLAIEYVSSEDPDGKGFQKARLIDVYRMKPNGEVEAYCHLRNALRNFRMNRIVRAEVLPESYVIPVDTQRALF